MCVGLIRAQSPLADFAKSLKKVYVTSLQQTVLNKKQNGLIVFQGEVEVQIDQSLRLWADRVFIDNEKHYLIAQGSATNQVSIEDNNFFLLAKNFTFNWNTKTGKASDVVLNVDEGYFHAKTAEKKNDGDWALTDIHYSACEKPVPHWRLFAKELTIHKNYLVKAKHVGFKIGKIPIFALPIFFFPVQGRAYSGFLVPRFSIDYEYGLGIKQDYYQYISPRCDTTFGIDWKAKKGSVFSNEFRWARSAQSFTKIKTHFALLKDRYLRKHNHLTYASNQLYWIAGNDFNYFPSIYKGVDLCSLMRLDFGTNKEIGYYFFNTTDDIDDTFDNSLILRTVVPSWAGSVLCDYAKVIRKNVDVVHSDADKDVDKKEKDETKITTKEYYDHYEYVQLPHVQLDTSYKKLFRHFYHNHTVFFDQWWYRQHNLERTFVDSVLMSEKNLFPPQQLDLVRFCYQGSYFQHVSASHNSFIFGVKPTWQAVSSVQGDVHPKHNVLEQPFTSQGAWRLFCEYGAEWALPSATVYSSDMSASSVVQPIISWEYLPKFYQQHWHLFDKWDRAYPKNVVAFQLRNNYACGNVNVDVDLKQGYDFYKSGDIFPLRRGLKDKHLLPFSCQIDCGNDVIQFQTRQEYEWRSKAFLESEVGLSFIHKRAHFGCSYLFQRPAASVQRDLLSKLPHFLNVGVAVPLSHETVVSYQAQLYADTSAHFFSMKRITPLVHRIRLDYDGHCWGFYIGYEAKKFKEFGMGRNEHSIVLALRLNSLGSFAKRFKRLPQFLKTQQGNERE